jgi:hypothetical protein
MSSVCFTPQIVCTSTNQSHGSVTVLCLLLLVLLSLLFLLFLNTQIDRQSQIARPDAVGKSIGSQELGILVRYTG